MSIEDRFDVPFIAALALKEKQIQQNYRPIIAVHKWFARRPGTLFRGLLLSEFGDRPLSEIFFESNDFPNRTVADPFMGGGIPLLEANRVGCNVKGFDINPMAAWIVREEVEHLDVTAYQAAADALLKKIEHEVGDFYRTDCPRYSDRDVPVKYFLWVKVIDCEKCQRQIDLFPGYLLADDTRHTKNVLVCSDCGELNEIKDLKTPGKCWKCAEKLVVEGPSRSNRCACKNCGHINRYKRPNSGPPKHRLFAIEYYNPLQKGIHAGRFFKKPDAKDLKLLETCSSQWKRTKPRFVPDQKILPGDETDRLHRWGYASYSEMFNERQLLGLETSCRLIASVKDDRIRKALATNLSDLLRYQNMLCRYDTMALKSLDIFSVHGFPVGLVQCESNMLGIINGNSISVGSGGWGNIIEKYAKAKRYCDAPFETRQNGHRKITVPIKNERIGEYSANKKRRLIEIRCTSSTDVSLKPSSLDAVFTDPPYFGNVQYGELMDFCYVWLRRLIGKGFEGFDHPSSRSSEELTGNITQGRDISHFTGGLSEVYTTMAMALKPGAPLAFTFHHNKIEAYHSIGVAILDAGFTCTAALPCPAEMGGSIHIHGTGSSIIDTVFVCRNIGKVRNEKPVGSQHDVSMLVKNDIQKLERACIKPSMGDIRCMVYGILTQLTINKLRGNWLVNASTKQRLEHFAATMTQFGDPRQIIETNAAMLKDAPLFVPLDDLPLFDKRAVKENPHAISL